MAAVKTAVYATPKIAAAPVATIDNTKTNQAFHETRRISDVEFPISPAKSVAVVVDQGKVLRNQNEIEKVSQENER